ncbi:hypothetical protein FOXB_12854 [Fusarium oxysporum f. sp. conglutinans Fo5176]|uniref:Uncharacterized protein n=1 Tax=Fusarium oxysporum (strain Fo5176) TaxID=660025 RepID=F9G2H2_FUSOF|nr:hypothetical protein FOXB_12854 [Fusarium oxysporum f. sp. conglutinans Fo5176]
MAAKDGGETDEQGQVPSGEAATSLTGPGHNDPILMKPLPRQSQGARGPGSSDLSPSTFISLVELSGGGPSTDNSGLEVLSGAGAVSEKPKASTQATTVREEDSAGAGRRDVRNCTRSGVEYNAKETSN